MPLPDLEIGLEQEHLMARSNSLSLLDETAVSAPIFGTNGESRANAKDINLDEVFQGKACEFFMCFIAV
jgi:hypothetical protein